MIVSSSVNLYLPSLKYLHRIPSIESFISCCVELVRNPSVVTENTFTWDGRLFMISPRIPLLNEVMNDEYIGFVILDCSRSLVLSDLRS